MASQSHNTLSSPSSTEKGSLSKYDCGLYCGLCEKVYSNPCLLPCLHSYCGKCIRQYQQHHLFTTEEGKKAFRCPDDTCQTLILETGVEFTKNLHLVRDVEAKRQFSSVFESETSPCDICDEDASSVMFCASCCEALCNECAKSHQRARKTKAHKLVTIKNSQSEWLKQAIRSHMASTPCYCPDHPEEVLKLYCTQCSQPACLVCMVLSHNGHKSSTMEEMVKSISMTLCESVEKLENPSTLLQKAHDDVANMKEDVTRQGKMVLKQIKDAFAEVMDVMNTRKVALTKECEEIVQAKLARLDIQTERICKLENHIKHSTQVASSSMKKYTPDELLMHSSTILDRLQVLTSALLEEQLSPCTDEGILCDLQIASTIKATQTLGSVVEGCHPPNCTLEVNPPEKPITCGIDTKKTLQLVTRDHQNKKMKHGGETVKAEIAEPLNSTSVSITDNKDGTYQVSFKLSTASQYKLFVTIRNQNVRGSPFEVVVIEESTMGMEDEESGEMPCMEGEQRGKMACMEDKQCGEMACMEDERSGEMACMEDEESGEMACMEEKESGEMACSSSYSHEEMADSSSYFSEKMAGSSSSSHEEKPDSSSYSSKKMSSSSSVEPAEVPISSPLSPGVMDVLTSVDSACSSQTLSSQPILHSYSRSSIAPVSQKSAWSTKHTSVDYAYSSQTLSSQPTLHSYSRSSTAPMSQKSAWSTKHTPPVVLRPSTSNQRWSKYH